MFDAEEKGKEFGDKWLPAFQSAFLEGWAERFYNELAATLREAFDAGHYKGVMSDCQCEVCLSLHGKAPHEIRDAGRLAAFESGRAAGRREVLEALEEAARVADTYRDSDRRGMSAEAWAGYSIGWRAAVEAIRAHASPVERSGEAPQKPKYVCPMKRPSGAPKNCGECKRNGQDKPGECYCCGATLILAPLTSDEQRAGAEDP